MKRSIINNSSIKSFTKNTLLRTLVSQAMPTSHNIQLKRMLAGSIVTAAALTSSELYAANLTFVAKTINVDEPDSGSRTVSVRPLLSFNPNASGWDNLTSCTITGEIEIYQRTEGSSIATPGVDYNQISSSSFSLTTQPYVVNDGTDEDSIRFDDVSQEILFDILDDGDETETREIIDFRISSYGMTCAEDDRYRDLNGGSETNQPYGSIIINDPLDQAPPPPKGPQPIPVRQKSLSSQLNSIRSLTLQTANTRNRSIAKEVNRARQSAGFNSKNLQVKIDGKALPRAVVPGAGAGDSFADFGRWGFFVSGSIDIGKQKGADSPTVDYDSSLLVTGIDYRVTNNIVMGSALSYTILDSGSKTETNFNRSSLSLFGSYYSEDTFYVDAIFTVGSSDYDLSREIETDSGSPDSASANTGGGESSASLGAGYNFHDQNANLRVFTFVNYIDVDIDAYNETVIGSSSAANVNGIDLQSLTADIGLEASWNINCNSGVYIPLISVAWEHQFADDAVDIHGNFVGGSDDGAFNFHGEARDNDYLNAQIGVSGVFKNGFSAYLSYDSYLGRKDLSSNHYSLGARWQF